MSGEYGRAPNVLGIAIACTVALCFTLYGFISDRLSVHSITIILAGVSILGTVALWASAIFIIRIKVRIRHAETSILGRENLQDRVEILSAIREISLLAVTDTTREEAAGEILNILSGPLEARRISLFVGTSEGLKPIALKTQKHLYHQGKIPLKGWETEAANLAYSQMRPVRVPKKGGLLVAYPFGGDEGARGVILFLTAKKKADENEKRMFHIIRAVSLALRMPALYERAVYDVLTGLYNRRHLNAQLPLIFDEARRTKEPLSVIMLDIDHFKTINDTYGHLFGDRVLCGVASCVQGVLRTYDSAYRYGGEEICIILPRTKLEDSYKVAQRCREEILSQPFYTDEGERVKVTVSGGVAVLCASDTTPQSLLERADAALYEAKESGRNRIVVAASSHFIRQI
ncbi:MAG: GGDEF domain-containing protein [Planctomycetota bacterium]|nr:GGDEF domain-containing protein [Planctomycetota bacterium]